MATNTNILFPQTPFIDASTGRPSLPWVLWLQNPSFVSATYANALPISSGGTGIPTAPTNGQLLIGNLGNYTLHTLSSSSGIGITNGAGLITIENTGVLSNLSGSGISVSNPTGNVTIANTGVLSANTGSGISVSGATGNVTFANTGVLSFSGGSTGLTPATATTGAVSLAGTLAVAYGGTGQTTYTDGQLLIGNTTGNTLAKSTLTAGSGISISNGHGSITIANTSPSSGGTVTSVSVVSANGLAGTVATSTTTPAITLSTTITGILKGNGTAISAATSGTDYAPATSGTSILYGNGAGGFSNVTIGSGISFATGTLSATGSGGTVTSVAALTLGTTGTDLSSTVANGTTTPVITLNVPTASATNRGALSSTDWTTFNNKGSGSVTSVSFTGGIIIVATATTTPALTVAGTSGGVPYFSSGTTWATSAALAANSLVIGGGAAVAPSTTTTGTGVLTALGTNVGSAGAFVTFNGALGTPSSGTVTNLTGTASININGTVGATTPTTGAFTTLSANGNQSFGITPSTGTIGTAYPSTLIANNAYTFTGASADQNYSQVINPQITWNTSGGTSQGLAIGQQITPAILSCAVGSYVYSQGQVISVLRNNASDASTNASNLIVGSNITAGHGTTLPSTSSSGTIYGQLISTNAQAGIVTNIYGIRALATIGAASGNTATVTNYYGLYLNAPSVGATGTLTNRYAIYQADSSSTNYLAGTTNVASTTDATSTTAAALITAGGLAVAKKVYIGDNVVPAAAKGVNFTGNTPASGMTSQLMNWYEEGTWTPVMSFTTNGDLAVTYSAQVGFYERIGSMVTAHFRVVASAFTYTTATGTFQITGLPFTSNATTNYIGVGPVYINNVLMTALSATATYSTARVSAGTSIINIIISGNNSGASTGSNLSMPSGNLVGFTGFVTYRV